jgi:hypothetical protein
MMEPKRVRGQEAPQELNSNLVDGYSSRKLRAEIVMWLRCYGGNYAYTGLYEYLLKYIIYYVISIKWPS